MRAQRRSVGRMDGWTRAPTSLPSPDRIGSDRIDTYAQRDGAGHAFCHASKRPSDAVSCQCLPLVSADERLEVSLVPCPLLCLKCVCRLNRSPQSAAFFFHALQRPHCLDSKSGRHRLLVPSPSRLPPSQPFMLILTRDLEQQHRHRRRRRRLRVSKPGLRSVAHPSLLRCQERLDRRPLTLVLRC